MHALSKKLYYDVMKSGQEDTILESDSVVDEYEQEDTPRSTSDVGCSVRTHMKSYAVQTQWSRNDKNFRNEYTNTSEVDTEAMSLNSPISRVIAIHRSLSCEDIAVTRVHSAQTTAAANDLRPLLKSGNKEVVVELLGFQIEKKGFAQMTHSEYARHKLASKSTKTELQQLDESTNTECNKTDMSQVTSPYYELQSIPCNRGLTACYNFTLGTAESRRFQNEHCKTKLIGGSRVPVCKSYKSRF